MRACPMFQRRERLLLGQNVFCGTTLPAIPGLSRGALSLALRFSAPLLVVQRGPQGGAHVLGS